MRNKLYLKNANAENQLTKLVLIKQLAIIIAFALSLQSFAGTGVVNVSSGDDTVIGVDQDTKTVTGVIKDEDGNPVPGAAIVIKGTTRGTTSGMDGTFVLEDVPDDGSLLISFVGMISQDISVSGRTAIEVTLTVDVAGIDEVVVIGYGTQKKSDLTGAISKVNVEDMANRTITRPEQAIQGKTAGVQIIQTSGSPGASPSVIIRGIGSNTSVDPLYIVDGLRTSNIGAIDPEDIESIEVLKDAASAAIYGAEAGNGVILISTKKGKPGVGTLSYDFQYVTNSLARIPDIMNATEYANYMTEGGFIAPEELNNLWDGVTDTDWVDVAFENSIQMKHNLSFRGGNDRGTYYLSLTYLDQDGIVKGDHDVYDRLTGMINADYNVKDWLKVGTTNIIEKWERQSVSENFEYGSLLTAVLTMDPLTPAYYTEDNMSPFMQSLLDAGRILLQDEQGRYYSSSEVYQSEQVHPLVHRDRTYSPSEGGNIMGTVFADFKPINGLTITSKMAYRAGFSGSYTYNYVWYQNAVAHTDNPSVSRNNSYNIYWQWENFATYINTIGKHNFSVMTGTSLSAPYSVYVSAGGNEFIKDDPLFRDLGYLTATATKTVGGGLSDAGRLASVFGRATYNYDNKYLFQASLRRDAGDVAALPKDNRWGLFPAFSLGYVISNESFFPQDIGLTHVKIRGSWGQNGSLGPLGGFSYRAAIGSLGSYPFYYEGVAADNIAYQVASGPNSLENPELKWETSEQYDIGIDLRALSDRLSLTFDYFHKETKDLLVRVSPPYETGVSSTTINAGNVLNTGVEVELGWNHRIGDFSYNIHANLSTVNNEVTYLDPSITRISGASYHTNSGITVFEVGYPAWYFRGYQLADDPVDDATGDPVFVDQLTIDTDGDGVPDEADGNITADDKVMIGNPQPDFIYGITLNAAFKGFDLTVFGLGSQGNDIFNCLTRIDRPRGNRLAYFYDNRWTSDNTTASLPRPNANGEDKFWISSASIFDGSYFKIKQIQLGYTIPQNLSSRIRISNLRLFASFDDWFVFTKYMGFDPEASAGGTSSKGVDKGSYPTSRKMMFGVNVTF